MQYSYAKFIATHYLQSAGERNVEAVEKPQKSIEFR